ncbi:MAG: hypothetical protein U0572_00770 [Phycisphaerales bacterium]
MQSIVLAALLVATARSVSPPLAPTYAADVAPIIAARCVECHQPERGAPFPLRTYDEVRRKARTIARVVGDRLMPPWPATQGAETFVDARRLSDAEIATIRAWVEAGAPEGEAATPAANVPASNAANDALGPPDLALSMPRAFHVPAEGPDIYRYFALPVSTEQATWVAAIAVRANEPSVVHHILYYFDESGTAHERESATGAPGASAAHVRRLAPLGGWAVGMRTQRFPLGLGRRLASSGDLVLQVHFHPDGKPHDVRLEAQLYFCKEPPRRELLEFQLPPEFGRQYGIDIPADESAYVVTDSWTIPADIDLVAVWAHAHMVCASASATATFPDGTTRELLTIPRWDFNWQLRYDFVAPVRLPKGTKVTGRLVYDNSAANPNNPYSPPRRVTWGEQTTDEMGSLIFDCVAADESDKPALRASYVAHAAGTSHGAAGRAASRLLENAKRWDTNGDRMLDASEVPARFRDEMKALDRNGDGKVSFDELDAGFGRDAGDAPRR